MILLTVAIDVYFAWAALTAICGIALCLRPKPIPDLATGNKPCDKETPR